MNKCFGVCNAPYFVDKIMTNPKYGVTYSKFCSICKASFNRVCEFCPCCSQILITKLQHATQTGSTKQ